MVINLPNDAERAWFQDGTEMREGFIMPDGAAYMIDKYGKTVRVNFDNNKLITEDKNADYGNVVNELNKSQTYNYARIAIGIIILLFGLIIACGGLNGDNGGIIGLVIGGIVALLGVLIIITNKPLIDDTKIVNDNKINQPRQYNIPKIVTGVIIVLVGLYIGDDGLRVWGLSSNPLAEYVYNVAELQRNAIIEFVIGAGLVIFGLVTINDS